MAINESQTSFDIPKDGYVAFDATSLRQLIVNRLNEQKVFTDQNFVGSNLASIIDIIAYSYHTLIYYLNKTSSESMFSEAQLYENINRIVKLIDYNPIGYQTSTLTFNCSAQTFEQGVYTLPRYSYLLVNNVPFSFNEDITFVKTESNTVEPLSEISQQKMLFQGLYQEYPLYTASGEENETVLVNSGTDLVDHFNIDVYVKSRLTNAWSVYTKTPNLFLENGIAKKYEIRLNANKFYEIKFGNNINGQKLEPGDQVAVYYLASNGAQGVVGSNAITPKTRLLSYNTIQFNEIVNNLFSNQYRYLTNDELQNLKFLNTTSSTPIKEGETAEDIRSSAPANYRSQYRLVTTRDYETFIKTNFTNLLTDIKCVNNWDYISTYLKYFYDLGITTPALTERALFNQVMYADSCNFNNLYLLVVPRSAAQNYNYLLPAQKQLINSSLISLKTATTETVFLDPVYKAVSFGVKNPNSAFNLTLDPDVCYIEVIKRTSSRRDNQSITNDIIRVIETYFSRDNLTLGQTVDVRVLTQQILNVDGVETFYTRRQDDPSIKIEGLSVFVWNPVYPNNDNLTTSNNVSLRYFEYPYFDNIDTLAARIKITAVSTVFESVEY
jgi:hypothetical protein